MKARKGQYFSNLFPNDTKSSLHLEYKNSLESLSENLETRVLEYKPDEIMTNSTEREI